MFKINFTLAATIVFVTGFAFALPAFAGAGGPSGPVGDGLGITRADGAAKLVVIDAARDSNPANYTYELFGLDTDTLFVADWDGDGNPSFGVARVDNGALLWILDFAGNGALTYELFGSEGDIPIVGDFDPASAGIEIGFARPDAGAGTLEWILNDNTPGTGFSRTLFGEDTDTPIPGNWDGDSNNGDELGVARDFIGARLWITQGSGGLDYALFGAAGDTVIPGNYDSDNNTDRAVRPSSGDGNVYIIDLDPLQYLQIGAPSDGALNSGTFGQD